MFLLAFHLQVKFVKEMLFSCRGQEAVVGRNARRMMMHLSISIDDDIQRTLSFYEKVTVLLLSISLFIN